MLVISIVFSRRCLEYGKWHIESPDRVKEAYEILRAAGYEFVEPDPAEEEDILRVHAREYIQRLKKGEISDIDTPAYEGMYDYARLSAGGAIEASRNDSFSLMRPPGHHAGIHGPTLGAPTLGFCYLNCIAIAVRKLAKPTLIIDIDGHHGNGTQEIFQNDESITYVSLHRHPYYPGTGMKSTNNCLNYSLESDCGEETYMKAFDNAISKAMIRDFEHIAVSAGFDAFGGDLASLGLTERTYAEIGKKIRSLEKRTFFVLEGGYSGRNIGKSVTSLLSQFQN